MLCGHQVRNPASNMCLDTLQKDEKMEFDMGLYSCQNGASANQVSPSLNTTPLLSVLFTHTHICAHTHTHTHSGMHVHMHVLFKRVRMRVVVVVVRELLFLVTSVVCVWIRGRGSEVTTTLYHIRSNFRLAFLP